MAHGATKASVVKTFKLKLKPSLQQRRKLEQWAGCVRYTYNKAIAAINNKKYNNRKSVFSLRDRFVTASYRSSHTSNNFFNNKQWLLECPKAPRKGAIDDAVTAYKAALSNFKAGNIKYFKLGFRSKRESMRRGWSMTLEKNNIRRVDDKLFIFKSEFGGTDIRYCSTKQLHKLIPEDKPSADCKLMRDKYGDYYLAIPTTVKVAKQVPINSVASVDPGIRKFATIYSPDKRTAYYYAANYEPVITSLLHKYDDMQSEFVKSKKTVDKRALAKQMLCLRKSISNKKKELRNQYANFLATEFDAVLMPKLPTSQLSMQLTSKVARSMMSTCHASVFDFVKQKFAERGKTLLQVDEAYTSQTCIRCGHLHKDGCELKTCPSCRYTVDRDLSGAACILLRAISYP